jgi:hypothetical protein
VLAAFSFCHHDFIFPITLLFFFAFTAGFFLIAEIVAAPVQVDGVGELLSK